MSNSKTIQDFLKDHDGVPDEVVDAANNIQDVVKSRGIKGAFLDDNGRFSTTRSANFACNGMLIIVFVILAFTAGNTVDTGMFKDGLTLPQFPAAGAAALAAILNATYAYKHKTNMENGNGA
jgi:hypothetical protein